MTLMGAIKQLHELRSAEDMPIYYKPVIAEVINVLLMDTQEVRHGHWVKSEDADDGYCSVCKCDMPMYREDWEWKYSETPYCPNCGAKMDEHIDTPTDPVAK